MNNLLTFAAVLLGYCAAIVVAVAPVAIILFLSYHVVRAVIL
jgi:hypothetical protein